MEQTTALNEAQVICEYYARRVDEVIEKLWESGQWDNEKNEAVLKEHLRTPYNVK